MTTYQPKQRLIRYNHFLPIHGRFKAVAGTEPQTELIERHSPRLSLYISSEIHLHFPFFFPKVLQRRVYVGVNCYCFHDSVIMNATLTITICQSMYLYANKPAQSCHV